MKNLLWVTPALAALAVSFAACGGGVGRASLTPAISVPASLSRQQPNGFTAGTMPAAQQPTQIAADAALSKAVHYISKAAAEQIALKAVGGGTVQQATLETEYSPAYWSVDISNRKGEYEVHVNAVSGKVLRIDKSRDSAFLNPAQYISKAAAEQIALKAVGGGTVVQAVLEKQDQPVHWSIDINNRRGQFEVWVNAVTGKVLKIIRG